jgi:hypothetical protein
LICRKHYFLDALRKATQAEQSKKHNPAAFGCGIMFLCVQVKSSA